MKKNINIKKITVSSLLGLLVFAQVSYAQNNIVLNNSNWNRFSHNVYCFVSPLLKMNNSHCGKTLSNNSNKINQTKNDKAANQQDASTQTNTNTTPLSNNTQTTIYKYINTGGNTNTASGNNSITKIIHEYIYGTSTAVAQTNTNNYNSVSGNGVPMNGWTGGNYQVNQNNTSSNTTLTGNTNINGSLNTTGPNNFSGTSTFNGPIVLPNCAATSTPTFLYYSTSTGLYCDGYVAPVNTNINNLIVSGTSTFNGPIVLSTSSAAAFTTYFKNGTNTFALLPGGIITHVPGGSNLVITLDNAGKYVYTFSDNPVFASVTAASGTIGSISSNASGTTLTGNTNISGGTTTITGVLDLSGANLFLSNILSSLSNILTSDVAGNISTSTIINSNSVSANAGVITTNINGVIATTSISNLYTFLASSTNSNLTVSTDAFGNVTYKLTDNPIFNSLTATTVNASTTNTQTLNASTTNTTNLNASGLTSLATTSISGGINLSGLTTGAATNSVMIIDPVTGVVSYINPSTLIARNTTNLLTNATTTNGVTLTSNVNGIVATTSYDFINSNTVATTTNSFTSFVNGISSAVINFINLFTQKSAGNILTTNINGIVATSSIINNNDTTFSTNGNIITNNINGVVSTTSLANLGSTTIREASIGTTTLTNVGTGSATSSLLILGPNGLVQQVSPAGLLASNTTNVLTVSTSTNSYIWTSIVNGIVSTTTAGIINNNTLGSLANILTSNVNGITSTSSIINSNTLSAASGVITSVVNGITATTSISNLYTFLASSTNNNLTVATATDGTVTYSFTNNPTFNSINASSSVLGNATATTLAIGFVATGTSTSSVLVYGPNGEVMKVTPAALLASNTTNLIQVSTTTNSYLWTTTVNGIVSTTSASIINQNALASAVNTLTSIVNGVSTTTNIINSNTLSTTTNTFQTIVNGVSSAIASIINSFTQSLSGNTLTTIINGVMATSSVISSNTVTYIPATEVLTTNVNGVISTTSIPFSTMDRYTTGATSLQVNTLGVATSTVNFTGVNGQPAYTFDVRDLDNQTLTYNNTTGQLAISAANGLGTASVITIATNTPFFITDGTNTQTVNNNDTVTFGVGSSGALTRLVSGTDTVTYDIKACGDNEVLVYNQITKTWDCKVTNLKYYAEDITNPNNRPTVLAGTQSVAIGDSNNVTGVRTNSLGSSNEIGASNGGNLGSDNNTTGDQIYTFGNQQVVRDSRFVFSSGFKNTLADSSESIVSGLYNAIQKLANSFVSGNTNQISDVSNSSVIGNGNNFVSGVQEGLLNLGNTNTINGGGKNNIFVGSNNTTRSAFSQTGVFGFNNTTRGDSSYLIGENLTSSGSNMVDIGTNDVTKLSIDNTGRATLRGAFNVANGDGATGQILQSQGVGAQPIWTNMAALTTNTLTVSTGTNLINLVSTVNGVIATTSFKGVNSNGLSSTANTITSTVNGIASTTNIINTNVVTSSANTLTTIVNGITSSLANIINSFTQSLTGNTLTTTINGVVATSSVISNNNLTASGTSIISNVNGVTTTLNILGVLASSTTNTLTNATNTNSIILSNTTNGVLATTTFNMINSNVLSFATTTGVLTSVVNGITSDTSIPDASITTRGLVNTLAQAFAGDKTFIGSTTFNNALTTITSGILNNSGLRFTNLTSASPAATNTNKVLTVNAAGDVVMNVVPGTENIVEFGVNIDPNTAGTTFAPAQPRDSDVIYTSTIDNSSWKWNGAAYVTYISPTNNWQLNGNSVAAIKTLGTINNFDLPIITNNTEKMRISTNGNVGINTTAPTNKLHVSNLGLFFNPSTNDRASIKVEGSYGGGIAFAEGANRALIWSDSGSALNFGTGGTAAGTPQRMTLTNVGDLGVGTTAPGNKVEITKGVANQSGLRFTNLTSAAPAAINTNKVLAVNAAGDVVMNIVPGTENIVDFGVNIDPNVAGTTFSPNQTSDPDVIYTSTIDNSSWKWNGAAYVAYTSPTNNWQLNGNTVAAIKTLGTKNNFDLPFITNNSERMRILTNGNVGIGTTAATNRLHVINNGYNPTANDQASIKVEGGYGGGIAFAEGLNRSAIWSDSGRALNFGTGGTAAGTPQRMTLTNVGDLGVGTTAPGNKVEITSTTANSSGLRFTNLTAASATTTINGKVLTVNATGDVILVDAAGNSVTSLIAPTGSNANAGSIVGNALRLSFADVTNPGIVSTVAQTIAGPKTLTGLLTTNAGINVAGGNLINSPINTIGTNNRGLNLVAGIQWAVNSGGFAQTLYNADVGAGDGLAIKGAGTSFTNKLLDISTGGQSAVGTPVFSVTGNGVTTITPTLANTSGLRLAKLISTSPAATNTNKVLTVNALGDVVMNIVPGTENIVDFGVNVDPNVAGTTFAPSQPADVDVIYASTIDNSSWKWNGAAYVAYTSPTNNWQLNGNTVATIKTLGTRNNFDLPIITNNVERMRILTNGNVGIGTTAPTTKLHVNSGTINDSGLRLEQLNLTTPPTIASVPLGIDATGKVVVASPLDLYRDRGMPNTLMTLSGVASLSATNELSWTNRLIILGGGRGAGTLSSSGYYDINMPPVGTVIPGVGGASSVTVTATGIQMRDPAISWTTLYYILPTSAGTVNANFRIAGYAADFVVPNDWVVVGAYNADIRNLKLGNGQILGQGQNTSQFVPGWGFAGNAGTVQANNFLGTTDNIGLSFRTNNQIRQTITNTGNTGIGTLTPTNRLHVINNGFNPSGNDLASIKVEGGFGGGISFAENANRAAIWSDNGSALNFGTGGTVAGTPQTMTLTNTGNLGIGTTAPTARLSVNGTANNVAGVWGLFSDERSKENVQNYARGLNDLMKLRPVTYNYKASMDMGTSTHVSFIAQELQQVVPEMVTNLGTINGIDNFLENNQEGLLYLTINAVKELEAQSKTGLEKISTTTLAQMVASGTLQDLTNQISTENNRDALTYIRDKMSAGYKAFEDFTAMRVTAIRGYFDQIFAKKIFTEELCVKKSDGTNYCVNGDQLQNMTGSTATASTTTVTTSTTTASTTPSTSTTTSTTASTTATVVCTLPQVLDVVTNACI